jgi:hypothetical protein
MGASHEPDPLEPVLMALCRLVGAHEVVSTVFLESTEQPTYTELLRYRRAAEANGLTMTMRGHHGVVLSRRRTPRAVDRDHQADNPNDGVA